MPETILGPKGYSILKKELSLEKQQWIRRQLTVKPMMPGAPVQSISSFSVWRENTTKMYLPRYFGEKHFGLATKCTLPLGDKIDLNFSGALRDYQKPVAEKFIKYITDPLASGGAKGGLLDLYPAWGKTSTALYIASVLKRKCMVIVGKEFLMNQWIERIHQFLPEARIGKIQGDVIDIDNKDIVLVMIQSLVSKNKHYPPETFSSFGFTILDEVHHVSSESFSRCMFSVVTRYILGLSGTMDRKDGTTDVFKMFLGEVVHKAERPANDMDVEVRKIKYISHDAEFDETILDFRGKPQISSMISKICQFHPRTNFILQVLRDFIHIDQCSNANIKVNTSHQICSECNRPDVYPIITTCCKNKPTQVRCLDCWEAYETMWESNHTVNYVQDKKTGKRKSVKTYPHGMCVKCPYCEKKLKYEPNFIDNGIVKPYTQLQTIVLAHNLNVLNYMYKYIVSTNMASVGFYVGGMKDAELKKSEKKHVILATFAMAAEGLDIASLNAEFMISPKTDVEQAVGRILRAKHSITSPVIYDFVDTHTTFQRQWLKRRKYYKKMDFHIVETTSDAYVKNTLSNPSSNANIYIKDSHNENEDDEDDEDDDCESEKNSCDNKQISDKNSILKGVCFLNLHS